MILSTLNTNFDYGTMFSLQMDFDRATSIQYKSVKVLLNVVIEIFNFVHLIILIT